MEVTGSRSWTHVVVVGLAALREEGFGVGAEVQQLRGVRVHRVELLGRGHARGGAALAVPHAARSLTCPETHARFRGERWQRAGGCSLPASTRPRSMVRGTSTYGDWSGVGQGMDIAKMDVLGRGFYPSCATKRGRG